MTKIKPSEDVLAYQQAEANKFWQLHPALESEMKLSWSAAGKSWKPSIKDRVFLELFYGDQQGYYDTATNPNNERIYFPELDYRTLLKFLIDNHNMVIQSIREDAESTRLYKKWLQENNPFDFVKDSVKTLVTGALVLLGIYIFIK